MTRNLCASFRPLNSHGFTVSHTVSLPFSRSHGRFFISHGFKILIGFSPKFPFAQFPKKTNKAIQSPVKKYRSIVLYIQKNNNSVIFDSETSFRSSPGNSCPVNYQKLYEKHPLLSGIVFVIFWKFLRTAIKNAYVGVSIKEAHYSNKKFCNINFYNFLIIFFFR